MFDTQQEIDAYVDELLKPIPAIVSEVSDEDIKELWEEVYKLANELE